METLVATLYEGKKLLPGSSKNLLQVTKLVIELVLRDEFPDT